ncbi:MAG: hypothetical protein GWN55_04425, partial [Phycisphaerae bacterium]|nr:hypothetical protein [Phycisphaerae bacterium]NIR63643.1 hypothetical protein [candidate division Zixibacteria bacterium]NIP56414.1 hypothetical protein [Phycisphaerae bacterium]NIS54865.1 hypothetical protein [Phycisphaerae bacterium]NIU13731.1 hypothetical protein [candidate division Zixibacteria bacterium]
MNAKSILIVLFLAGWCYAQKEGYTQAFFLPPHENDGNDIYPIFTVPAGKEFVLQMLYTEGLDTGWFLLKNDVAWLFGDNHIQRIVG